jgi:hypothetical protein
MPAPPASAVRPYRRPGAPAPGFDPHVKAGAPPFADLVSTPARPSSLSNTLTAKLTAFSAGQGNGRWPHLPRAEVAMRLTQLARNPTGLNQAGLNACGSAAAMYLFAKRHPERFADFVIALYEQGKGQFGTLQIAADGLEGRNPATMDWEGNAPKALDWMVLSALQRSEGNFDGEPSDSISGITFPGELEGWLRNGVGYTSVANEASKAWTKGLDHLRRLSPGPDVDIVVLINVGVVTGEHKKGKKPKQSGISPTRAFPNHWFVLERPVADAGGRITATGWTWGQSGYPFEGTHDAWDDGYFGAMIAKV